MAAARSVTRPVLRFHGGKFLLAPWIISHFPKHRIYVEPFGGAASVLMQKSRCYSEVYNDIDGEIVRLFEVLRDRDMAAKLENQVRLTPFSRKEYEKAFLPSGDPVEGARRLLFRSFAGFAGTATHGMRTGFRCDTKRSGQVPAHDWLKFPESLSAITRRLQGVVIESQPAIQLIARYDDIETLFYCDPPYPAGTRDKGTDYRYELTDEDHCELAERLHCVAGMVILSGYPCSLYDDLYGDWQRVERKALADGARERTEVLWLNPAASEAMPQRRMF